MNNHIYSTLFETAATGLKTSEEWLLSNNERFRANIIVCGMPKDIPTLEIRPRGRVLGRRAC